ncbi:MAG: hypothetical protein AABW87_03905 [Nanoarchaeota archaeon]
MRRTAARKYTKAQLQLTETILVVFAIAIIVMLGTFLFYRYSIQGLSETGERLSEQQTSVLLARITSMAELGCGEENCMDTSKFIPFKNLIGARDYRNIFGSKRITVEQAYPEVDSDKECNVQSYNQKDYPDNCKKWILYDNAGKEFYAVSTPVVLYFPEVGEYRLGILKVEASR